MSSAAVKHFDMLAFVKRSKELGVKEDLAEYQARQLEQVIDIASAASKEEFNAHEFSTKTDLKQVEVNLKQVEVNLKQVEANLKQVEANLKIDIKQLEVDLNQVEANLKIDIKQLEVDLKSEIKQLEIDLKKEIKHLDVKIEQYRYDTLKFIVWTGIGVVVFLSGLLAKGFHWLS